MGLAGQCGGSPAAKPNVCVLWTVVGWARCLAADLLSRCNESRRVRGCSHHQPSRGFVTLTTGVGSCGLPKTRGRIDAGRVHPMRPGGPVLSFRRLGIVATGAALLALTLIASVAVGLLLAPAMLLAIVLYLGLFPGEELIHRLSTRRFRRRPAVRATNARLPRYVPRLRRAGVTLAFALAVRPPPAVAA